MFFGSATQVSLADAPAPASLLRDLAASLLTIGALGALLIAIQLHSGAPRPGAGGKTPPASPSATTQTAPRSADTAARQPRDEAATPDADEERIARAMVAFALSKVSPLQPEPMTSIPASPLALAAPQTGRKVARPAMPPRLTSPGPAITRISNGVGSAGFVQAEWPAQMSSLKFSTAPKDRPALAGLTRFVPSAHMILTGGAQNIASGARKTVDYGVSGLRSGVSAVQERAVAVTGKLW